MQTGIKCRCCNTELKHTFVNLGKSPPANSYLTDCGQCERFLPLHVYVCHRCFLVQLPEHESPADIFTDYAYFSSYSESWLKHAKQYADMITQRQALTWDSLVIELASNDGYLLQYFVEKGIPVLGIEPAKNIAAEAVKRKVPTISEFFGSKLADKLAGQGKKADLVVANNVLAHVPDINDFVSGISTILKDDGIVTLEFPSVYNLIRFNQFDTIYHEHFSYLSLSVVTKILKSHGLTVFDAQELPTHGGSLRVYAGKCTSTLARKSGSEEIKISANVERILETENLCGLNSLDAYLAFSESVRKIKRDILKTLVSVKEKGETIVGYGAAAKGNTLLNYCGIRDDFLDFTVDISPHKQGKYLPGTNLLIRHPDSIKETKPDYIFILPWNIKDEIMQQLKFVRQWGCKFIVPIPSVEVV